MMKNRSVWDIIDCMNLFPAKPFDIDSIMAIERQAFIPQIQEKRRCFESRLEVFPEGFFILSDASEGVVQAHGNALTCGYFSSERWDSFPSASDSDDVFARKFSLGHNIAHTHVPDGAYLYVSSFALRKEYQGRGTGRSFFEASCGALCGASKSIEKIVVLVNEEWKAARAIYGSLGFCEVRRLPGFFPTIRKTSLFKREMSDGIVMAAAADVFRGVEFSARTDNMWEGITL